jgi:hypothetical protein
MYTNSRVGMGVRYGLDYLAQNMDFFSCPSTSIIFIFLSFFLYEHVFLSLYFHTRWK